MSGIPGMGQRWQAALKRRMIMIPLPETTAAGAASGVCRSVRGCYGAWGSQPDGPYISLLQTQMKNFILQPAFISLRMFLMHEYWTGR